MPAEYKLPPAADLTQDVRLKSDARLQRQLAQSIALVLGELTFAERVAVTGPDTARSKLMQALTLKQYEGHPVASLIDIVTQIAQHVPGRIQQAPPNQAQAENQQKIADAQRMCGYASLAIIGRIVPNDERIRAVFGDAHAPHAKLVLREAAANLMHFCKGDATWTLAYDPTIEAAGEAASGSKGKITFADSILKNNPVSWTMLLHEATHTIPDASRMTRDHLYRDSPGFLTAPADIKIKNAAHYEELGWQLLVGEQHRAFIPGDDIKAIVTMIVTNAWIMSGWLYDSYVSTATAGASFKKQGSRILGLSLHPRAEKNVKAWGEVCDFFAKKLDGDFGVGVSAVDKLTAAHKRVTLSKCLGALRSGALNNYAPQGNNLSEKIDDALGRLIQPPELRLRKSPAKSILMIKALAALYLIDTEHYKMPQGQTDVRSLLLSLADDYDRTAPNAVLERYAGLLDGHAKRVAPTL